MNGNDCHVDPSTDLIFELYLCTSLESSTFSVWFNDYANVRTSLQHQNLKCGEGMRAGDGIDGSGDGVGG